MMFFVVIHPTKERGNVCMSCCRNPAVCSSVDPWLCCMLCDRCTRLLSENPSKILSSQNPCPQGVTQGMISTIFVRNCPWGLWATSGAMCTQTSTPEGSPKWAAQVSLNREHVFESWHRADAHKQDTRV